MNGNPAASSDVLLRMTGVTKTFPGVKALDEMHIELRKGETLALVGENGAGKSTLMKLLSGIYHPDAGTIEVYGEERKITRPREAQDLGIQIIHQEFQLANDLSVAQNIFLGREELTGRAFLRDAQMNRHAGELLERLGLAMKPKTLVGNLSVAEQQMVEIAKALSRDAKILILDEPTAALNDAEVAKLHELIKGYISPETGCIYISHRLDELADIANRVQVIRDGTYIDTLDIAEASIPKVVSLMVGREIPSGLKPEKIPNNPEVVLKVDGLTNKKLDGVSFELRKGEILGFAGLMGAGRTETARAVVGADPITAGTIEVNGQPVKVRTPTDAAAHGIGYLSEDRKQLGLLLERTVSDNIVLSALEDQFVTRGFVKKKAQRVVAEEQRKALKIKTPSVDRAVKNLSGGNQQKVVIAKWLVKNCDVLIFDEPTRGIDVGAKEEIYRLLNRLTEEGKSIIVISSELPEVLRLSHRVLVMSDGRITGELSSADANQESIMHLATTKSTLADAGA